MLVEPGTSAQGGEASLLLRLAHELAPELLSQALTHSSWVEERYQSYERLEFLGDSVLGLAIASYLYRRFPGQPEGRMAKLKAYVVSRGSCAVVARRIGIDQLIVESSPGDEAKRQELAGNPVALGNILEALIGAVFLERGYEVACQAVVEAFTEQIYFGETYHVDYKSTLQEYLAALDQVAKYQLIKDEGPPHLKIFTSQVIIGGEVQGEGTGRSIKTSEQEAAREALLALGVLPPEGS